MNLIKKIDQWQFLLFLAVFSWCLVTHAQTGTESDWRYTVKPYDTLSGLTRQYLKVGVNWQDLARHNHLPNADLIHTGTKLKIPLIWLAARQAEVQLTAISGDVQIQQLNGVWIGASVGDLMQTGQHIRVGRNSSARLKFADDSQLVIQPESSVSMDALSVYAGGFMVDTRLRLQSGRVEVHANPKGRKGQKFDVITPAAVASVRGTEFVVEAHELRTIEQTNQGLVELKTNLGIVMVKDGYSSVVKTGEKPQAPELVKPAPHFESPATRFDDFPIAFSWTPQADVAAWTVQIGRDPQMANLIMTKTGAFNQLNAGGLPDGRYYLRAWSVDMQGMPSKPAVHAFEVNIPRKIQGRSVLLPPSFFSAGQMALTLPPLSQGKRYLVQMTTDAEGLQTVWHQAGVVDATTVPQPAEAERAHHLWIWIY